MGKMKKRDEAFSGHTPISNRLNDKDFAIDDYRTEEPSPGGSAESAALQDDGHEDVEGVERDEIDLDPTFTTWQTGDLPDMAEASFGPPSFVTETIHGLDDRIQIHNTHKYPWCMTASLLITARDNTQWCGTGFFIGPHTLMTAGHDVFVTGSGAPGRDGWVKQISIKVAPYNGTLPYGPVTSTSFRTVVGWAHHGLTDYNYGAIILPRDLGYKTGWFGFRVYSDVDLLNTTGNLAGYICSKLMYGLGKIVSVTNRRVYYDIDTSAGQAGSAVYNIRDGGRYVFAIHNAGGLTYNSGTRICSPVFKNMTKWRK
jgi:V8-like Glu-specific endopeptidase